MKSSKLKVIAEGMGYEAEIRDKDFTYEHVVIAGNSHVGIKWLKYNPLTNNDQMVEIIERLCPELYYDVGEWYCTYEDDTYVYGKTINEAVCNAAYEQ